MYASKKIVLLSLVASSLAITVTSPSQGVTWSSSGSHTITWNEVSTDPTTFAVTLVQQGVFKQTLADSVDGTKGSLTVTVTLPVGTDFQVNIVKSSQDVDTILAQSAQFNITGGNGASTSTSSSTGNGIHGGPSTGPGSSTGSASSTSTPATGTSLPNTSTSTPPSPSTSSNTAAAPVQYYGSIISVLSLLGLVLV